MLGCLILVNIVMFIRDFIGSLLILGLLFFPFGLRFLNPIDLPMLEKGHCLHTTLTNPRPLGLSPEPHTHHFPTAALTQWTLQPMRKLHCVQTQPPGTHSCWHCSTHSSPSLFDSNITHPPQPRRSLTPLPSQATWQPPGNHASSRFKVYPESFHFVPFPPATHHGSSSQRPCLEPSSCCSPCTQPPSVLNTAARNHPQLKALQGFSGHY